MKALDYKKYTVSERLDLLAQFLEQTQPIVDMGDWYCTEDKDDMLPKEVTGAKASNSCGASACGLGWSAVLFDLSKIDNLVYWQDACKELFELEFMSDEGQFLFSSHWSAHQHLFQERDELIARIRLYLESGLPEEWSFGNVYSGGGE